MGYSLHARVCIYLIDRKNPLEIGGFFLSIVSVWLRLGITVASAENY